MIEDHEVLDAAKDLCLSANQAEPVGFSRLTGGKNNRVFAIHLSDSQTVVLKSYFSDARDPRDRLAAEWAFLTYARDHGVENAPQPLVCDNKNHLGLYSFVPGVKLDPADIGIEQVDAALSFILQVNSSPRDLSSLPAGSEACFSLSEHIQTIEGRIARLADLDTDVPLLAEAQALVDERLNPAWAQVRRSLEGAGFNMQAQIGLERQCVSPSDFGFHNALAHQGRISFIDFEYAGRDDPAKLASDLFCCPEIPVPESFHAHFVEGLVKGLGLGDEDRQRCYALLPAYRIKWACIILNLFLPTGRARRKFANLEASHQHCTSQLARAERMLQSLGR